MREYEKMAKLDLPEEERQWVSQRAEKLLESFSVLESIDTANAEPLITVLAIENVFREDAAGKTVSREELLANAPAPYGGYFQAPKTID